jgi:diguanylate cyclase
MTDPVPVSKALRDWLLLADPTGPSTPQQGAEAATVARALALAEQRPLEAARAGGWLASQLNRAGLHVESQEVARQVLTEMDAAALQPDRQELLRVLTLSASEVGAFDVALDAAHDLVRSTADTVDDGPALIAAYSLAVCFERMGDSWQAVRVLGEALARRGRSPPGRPLLLALNGLCAVTLGAFHRRRGLADDCELRELLERGRDAGQQARALLPQATEAAFEVAIVGNLGEVELHLGHLAEAQALLDDALALGRRHSLTAHLWRIAANRADLLLAVGQPEAALVHAQEALAEMGASGPQETQVRAHRVAYRACRQLGRFEQALHHFETLELIERRRATSQLQAQSQLFVSRVEAQRVQLQVEHARLEAQQARARAAEFAAHAERDPLTGLGNRRHLARRVDELLPAAARAQQPLALAVIDLDHFKQVNDVHGHAVGDLVLGGFAQLLRENTRGGDVLVRHGGEEFVVVLPDTPPERAREVCERLREQIAQHAWPQLPAGLQVTVSIGVASAPAYDALELMRRADLALYTAKRDGRNQVRAN